MHNEQRLRKQRQIVATIAGFVLLLTCIVLGMTSRAVSLFVTSEAARPSNRGCPALPTPLPADQSPFFEGRIALRASCGYGGQIDLFLLEGDGGIRNLTQSRSDELEFSWSPDGKQLAFASDRSGNFDVWTIDVEGGTVTQLTTNAADDRQPSWSPDGTHIAFVSFRDAAPEEERGEIYVVRPDATGERRLTNNQVVRAGQKWIPWLNGEEHDLGVWSPDGQTFAADVEPGVTLFYLDGRPSLNIYPQTPRPLTKTGTPANDHVVDWSPDGTRLLLTSNRGGYETDDWVMYVLDLETQQLTRLVHQTGMQPRWSPDSSRILFRENKGVGDAIYTIAPDGSDEKSLTSGACNPVDIGWSPDGSQIAYSTLCQGNRLIVMRSDGTGQQGFLPIEQWLLHHHQWAPQP